MPCIVTVRSNAAARVLVMPAVSSTRNSEASTRKTLELEHARPAQVEWAAPQLFRCNASVTLMYGYYAPYGYYAKTQIASTREFDLASSQVRQGLRVPTGTNGYYFPPYTSVLLMTHESTRFVHVGGAEGFQYPLVPVSPQCPLAAIRIVTNDAQAGS